MVSDWLRALSTWRMLRRRFAEEWAFHLDAASAEWESLGFRRSEARKQAKRRLGSKYAARRRALPSIGGDFAGLVELLPLRALRRSALPFPLILLSISVLSIALDPFRAMALECLKAILMPGSHLVPDRLIPATPTGLVPVDLAAVVLRVWAIVGLMRIALHLASRDSWRLCLYAAGLLAIMAFSGAVFWIVGLQFLAHESWNHDGIQGLALLAFSFVFVGLIHAGSCLWWADIKRRCPICLRVPGMPEQHGKASDILVDPLEVKSICFQGHGVITRSRWSQHFAAGATLFPQ